MTKLAVKKKKTAADMLPAKKGREKPRIVARQAHVRFKVALCKEVTPMAARKALLGKVGPTGVQYTSNLSPLKAYLEDLRKVKEVDVFTTTEDEFLQFLFNWREQGKGPARGVSSALLAVFLQGGKKNSFLEEKSIKRAVEAASANARPVDKGVLDKDMEVQFQEFLLRCPDAQLGKCTWCASKKIKDLRGKLVHASRLMGELPIRPGNLKDLRIVDLAAAAKPPHVYVAHPKVPGENAVVASDAAVKVFREAAGAAVEGYLFPRCASMHLGTALRHAEVAYGWVQGLVFTPGCFRHTMMTKRVNRVTEAEDDLATGVSARTRKAHYTKPVAKRRRAK